MVLGHGAGAGGESVLPAVRRHAGRVVAKKSAVFTRLSTAPASQRIRVRRGPIAYRITKGAFAGYLVPESPATAQLRGEVACTTYRRPRTVTVAAGSPVRGHAFRDDNSVARVVASTPSAATVWTVNRRAWIAGEPYLRMASGPLAGLWVKASTHGVTMD